MKLYVLFRQMVGDDLNMVGIFSSMAKAEEAKRVMETMEEFNEWDFFITERTLDPCVCAVCSRYTA